MEGSTSSNSKRRRGLGVVTANACNECRKKRAKCDGQTPCGRCEAQSVECVYELPVRQSKEHMRSELEALRTSQRQSDRVMAALVSKDESEDVLEQLRSGETLESIADKLDSGSRSAISGHTTTFTRLDDSQAIGNALQKGRSTNSPLSIWTPSDAGRIKPDSTAWSTRNSERNPSQDQDDEMSWDNESNQQDARRNPLIGTWYHHTEPESISPRTIEARGHGQEKILGSDFGTDAKSGQSGPNTNQSWTRVTDDAAFVEHLMALYFCWEYPTFASLDQQHFLEDFKAGNERYCSSLLVNSLLAVGCRFSNQASAQLDPNDPGTRGDHFFAEATRLLELEPHRHKLTTIQAMGLMSIREASCGRSSHSIYLSGQSILLAIEMGLHQESRKEDSEAHTKEYAVRSTTFWGAFSLDHVWSLSIGRLPHFSRITQSVTKPPIVDRIESIAWVPYTDDGMPLETACTQPSNVRTVYRTFCDLSEIVHRALYMLYTPNRPVTSKILNEIYVEYINWYSNIPAALRLGQNFTPSVLFAHIYYHTAILLLFRPFIKLEIVGSGVSPRDLCVQAAETICVLLKSYSDLYTLQRTPSFLPYFVLESTMIHISSVGKTNAGIDQLYQAMSHMREMATCHRFATRAVGIIHYLVKYWKVDFEMTDEERDDQKDSLDSSTLSMNLFCPCVEDVNNASGLDPVTEGGSPLFWSFPLQGRPMLASGAALKEAGFKALPS